MDALAQRIVSLEATVLALARAEFGGPGSGAQPGHPFEGNQWDGSGGKGKSSEPAKKSEPEPKKKGFFGKAWSKYKAGIEAQSAADRAKADPSYHTKEAKAERRAQSDAAWARAADISILPVADRNRAMAGYMTDAEIKAAAEARRKEMQ